jgi:isopentenyl-diphosphate delta-isomerase
MADVFLDVVNENDEVIGQALRSEIHQKGLKHREIHVWFITPDKQIIFQKRAMDKDTFPGLLDATAGGHVELGASYQETALAEVLEETGIEILENDLHFITKRDSNAFDNITGKTNNVFREVYGCIFNGKVSDLKIEDGMGAGFKAVPIKLIYNPTQEILAEAIGDHIQPEKHYIFQALEKLVS